MANKGCSSDWSTYVNEEIHKLTEKSTLHEGPCSQGCLCKDFPSLWAVHTVCAEFKHCPNLTCLTIAYVCIYSEKKHLETKILSVSVFVTDVLILGKQVILTSLLFQSRKLWTFVWIQKGKMSRI